MHSGPPPPQSVAVFVGVGVGVGVDVGPVDVGEGIHVKLGVGLGGKLCPMVKTSSPTPIWKKRAMAVWDPLSATW